MKDISSNSQIYIIAEIGMNHDGSFGNALKLIEAAAEASVDAVKFQLHISEAEMVRGAPAPPYFKNEDRWDYFNRTAFTDDQWQTLTRHAHKLSLDFIVSPFSVEAVEKCINLESDYLKIPSGEVNNIFLLNAAKKSKMACILSSGMSSYKELDMAIEALSENEALKAILQCSSKYPCSYEDIGLNVLTELVNRYPKIPIGLSDHTLDNYASFASVVLGAKVIERHFALSKKAYGPDAMFSLEPAQLKELVTGIRAIETMMKAKVHKDELQQYEQMRSVFCKSITAKDDIKKGEVLTYDKLGAKKPGTGIPANQLASVLNRKAKINIQRNNFISYEYLE